MGRKPLQAALTAAVAVSAGCLQYNHLGYDTALRAAADHPVKMPVRAQVYLFVLNGADLTDTAELERLRDGLACAGFPMVYYAQRADVDWYYREMHRLHRDQPAARFVLAGFGLAAARTRGLAAKAAADGLPLDALVLLDPAGVDTPDTQAEETVPLTVLRSHHWPAGRGLPGTDVTELPGVGHLSLPSHPQTVAVLVRLMTASTSRVTLGPTDALPHLPLTEHPQPTPRPVLPVVLTPLAPPAGQN